MRKIYHGMKKRQAKKLLGRLWYPLQAYAKGEIKVGTVIHTCSGYNKTISVIHEDWCWSNDRGATCLGELDFDFTDGSSCSLTHCCTFPTPPTDQIVEYFKMWGEEMPEEYESWDFGDQHNLIVEAIKNNEMPFNEDGTLKTEYTISS